MGYKLKCGVYAIENLVNGMIYIGKSKSVFRRWYEHRHELTRSVHYNDRLQRSWNKHGDRNFRFSVIEECGIESLQSREEYWIGHYIELLGRTKVYNWRLEKDGKISGETLLKLRKAGGQSAVKKNPGGYLLNLNDGGLEYFATQKASGVVKQNFLKGVVWLPFNYGLDDVMGVYKRYNHYLGTQTSGVKIVVARTLDDYQVFNSLTSAAGYIYNEQQSTKGYLVTGAIDKKVRLPNKGSKEFHVFSSIELMQSLLPSYSYRRDGYVIDRVIEYNRPGPKPKFSCT